MTTSICITTPIPAPAPETKNPVVYVSTEAAPYAATTMPIQISGASNLKSGAIAGAACRHCCSRHGLCLNNFHINSGRWNITNLRILSQGLW